jgi:DNA mismatch endonuclease, patch repair protein
MRQVGFPCGGAGYDPNPTERMGPSNRQRRPRHPEVTSRLMSRVRGTGNKAEVALRKELWKRGYRYQTYAQNLPGTPDIVFRGSRIAIFVDGDFWHGRILIENGDQALVDSFQTERRDFWIAKIRRNVSRDRQKTAELHELGWRVIRVWERDILRDLSAIADQIEKHLRR